MHSQPLLQFEEEEYKSAAKTAAAIKLLGEKISGKVDLRKKKAEGLLNNPSANVKESMRKKLQSSLKAEVKGIEEITQIDIDASKESLSHFLKMVHKVWLNTLPG